MEDDIMKVNYDSKDVIHILNSRKNEIDYFEIVGDFFIVRFKDGNRVEVEAERDCGVFASFIDMDKN
jgi:hypothetical protein